MEKEILIHFPIENEKKIKQMEKFWKEDEFNLIKDSLRTKTN